MVKAGVNANVSIPQHRELSVGTLRALIRNSGLTVDEFRITLTFDGFIEVAVGKETQLTITDEVLFEIFLPEINQYE